MKSPTIQTLRRVLNLPPDQFNRVLGAVLEMSDFYDGQYVSTYQILMLSLADVLYHRLGVDHLEALVLLQQMKTALHGAAGRLDRAEGDRALLPDFRLGFADHKYATWPDERPIANGKFYDYRLTQFVPALTSPPVITSSVDVNALYYQVLQTIERCTDAATPAKQPNAGQAPVDG